MRRKIDFLTLLDFERAELDEILAQAEALKRSWRAGESVTALKGMVLGLVFHKPSLRTRLSFEVGMRQLGGSALYITDAEIGFGRRETIGDIGEVMSRYLDGIMIRTFSQEHVVALARAAAIPVLNGLTDWVHPCQILADLFTLREKGFALDGLRVAYVGDGNNVTNSWIHATRAFELDLRIATPAGYEPDRSSVERVRDGGRGKVRLFHEPLAAVAGAQVIYTDTWTSMGQEGETEARRAVFPPFQVNDALLAAADPAAVVMHCLPAHRGEEITDAVMDGPRSIVFDQAENRLHAQKGIMLHCLG
ncbi:MAG: ornithine carbamoyltransferase [Candidatus Eisenbacteria bacterium]